MNSSGWLYLSARVCTAIGLGLGLGFLAHAPWAGLAIALGIYLAAQLADLLRVLRWLRANEPDLAPELGGPWGDLVALVVRLYRRKQFHKQRLLRLLRELRRSTAAMPDGVVVLNPQAEILWFNRTAARLLNLRGKSDIGLRLENLVRSPEFVRYLRRGEYALPVILNSSLGAEQQCLSLQIVPYGAGQLLALVRDVTRQARLESMRKDFVANASHELRSPLTVISGYLETLTQETSLDPTLAAPLHEMRRQALRMSGIVQDLLELSQLEASDRSAQSELIDVIALMAQLRQDVLARTVRPAQVLLHAESSLKLLGEEALIHSAFANLVDNAAKYTPPEGALHMRWWTDAKGGHFSVQDTGIGIAADHIPRLTERFYRVDAGRSRATGGSGLGLAIVKHVLQRHGAQLSIESEEGRGSTFTCHFPPERLQSVTYVAAGGAG
jgi:two-component system, OmpR family, phosphate regulon sensor histidine kinase PhoR